MKSTIAQLISQKRELSAAQCAQLIETAAAAPFSPALLAADEPLWGSFWQFDVIAPGYRLPALELALLRAVRLDSHWPESTSPAHFLADLRAAIPHPKAGMWTLTLAGAAWAVFATAPAQTKEAAGAPLLTVVWYCPATGFLHAGYRIEANPAHFSGMLKQRPLPGLSGSSLPHPEPPHWLERTLEQRESNQPTSQAGRFDTAILRWRASVI